MTPAQALQERHDFVRRKVVERRRKKKKKKKSPALPLGIE